MFLSCSFELEAIYTGMKSSDQELEMPNLKYVHELCAKALRFEKPTVRKLCGLRNLLCESSAV